MFITHTGERVTGIRLVKARKQVSDDLVQLAIDIFDEDCYASHVSYEDKLSIMFEGIERAKAVLHGTNDRFTVNQRINEVLTGECVSLLP